VVTIEGDGGLLMGFSVLSTIGMLKPEKLVLVILDNGTYASTGNQPTAALTTDFAGVAKACGMTTDEVDSVDGLRAALEEAKAVDGPVLIRARINLQGRKTPYFLEDPVVLADTFRRYLAKGTSK
jgi:sulfopyruvate decarboxylase subunit beta